MNEHRDTDMSGLTDGVVGVRAAPSSWYRHYTLLILTLVYASSFMDRQITSILLEDLKAEFTLSDLQLGLLSGLAFALFYGTLGVPIARLADRHSRVKIITIAISIWSVMTAVSGAATSFLQLLAARVGVGVGEAGASPPSHSIISDYYEPKDRSLALSIWAMGTVVGSLAGLVLGGYIAEHYGWRMAFVAAGLPGIALALLVWFTVREPQRGGTDHSKSHNAQGGQSLFQSILNLWGNKLYRWAVIAHVAAVFFGFALAAWLPALFIRKFDLTQTQVGAIAGATVTISGVAGLLAGGALASYMARRNPAWEARVPAIALVIGSPFLVFALNTSAITASAIAFGIAFFFYQCSHGPGLAIVQSAVRPDQRALASAVMYLLSNMLALGIGPLIVGFISDLGLGATPGVSLAIGLHTGVVALIAGGAFFWYVGTLLSKENETQAYTP